MLVKQVQLGAVISQSLSDQKNAQLAKDAEFKQKSLEVATITKDESIASKEDANVRSKIVEDARKKQEELEKEKLTVEKEQLKSLQNLEKNTGGPSTVVANR